MLSIFRSKGGVRGLNLFQQQRNVRILNSNPLYKDAQSSNAVGRSKVYRAPIPSPLPSTTSDELEVSDSDAIQKKNPKIVFISELMESLQRKDVQKLFLSENKQINQEGSKVQNLKSITGRLIEIKSGLRFQLVYRYTTNDITKNLPIAEVEECITNLLAVGFKRASLSSGKGTHDLSLKRGAGTLKIVAATPPESDEIVDETPNFQHDRRKNVPLDCNAPFLRALKVTTEGGRPFAGMADKYRQIQKFVEILGGLVDRSKVINKKIQDTMDENLAQSSVGAMKNFEIKNIKVTDKLFRKPSLRMVDMGSGMAYLTFSAHSHLSQKFDLETIGVEARDNLVKQTNSIARNLGSEFSGLSFVEGNILDYFSLDLPQKNIDDKVAAGEGDVEVEKRSSGDDNEEQNTENWEKSVKGAMRNLRKKSRKEYLESNKMDVLIALHACDTATDDAIWCGIQAGAQIIVTAPCCHKQVRGQLDRHVATAPASDISGSATGPGGNGLTELLQHGIYREREAEMVTDTLRALLLEWCGYSTTVFEFIGGEHTAKNVMIAAIKRPRVSGSIIGSDAESDSARNLVRAKEVLASIEAGERAKKVEKKKKFQSVSVNAFGDVDVDSYDENATTESRAEAEDSDSQQKLDDIADMISNNERVAIMEEEEESAAIARRIINLMKTFGVKNFKLYDLIFENEAEERRRNKNKVLLAEQGSADANGEPSGEASSGVAGEEKVKKQLKLKKFRR